MSLERNGDWRHTNLPCFGRTWAANYFEWTVFGWCWGIRLPRLRKGTPPPDPGPFLLTSNHPTVQLVDPNPIGNIGPELLEELRDLIYDPPRNDSSS